MGLLILWGLDGTGWSAWVGAMPTALPCKELGHLDGHPSDHGGGGAWHVK